MKELSKNLFLEEAEIQKYLYNVYVNPGTSSPSLKTYSKLEYYQKDIKGYRSNLKQAQSLGHFLKFMKLCCENNYNEFKEYFMEQRDKAIKSSVNMVDEVLINECLEGYSKSCHSLNFDLGILILETLTEILEGRASSKIKQLVTSSQILKYISEIFKHVSKMDIDLEKPSAGSEYRRYLDDYKEMQQSKFTLITKVTELLITLIEYSDEETHFFIIEKLDFDSLIMNTTENLFETFEYNRWLDDKKLDILRPKEYQPSRSFSNIAKKGTFLSQGTMSSAGYEGYVNPYKLKSTLFLLEKKIKKKITEEIFQEHFLGLVNLTIVIKMLSSTNKKSREKVNNKLNEIFRDNDKRDNVENEKARFLLNRISEEYITQIEILGEDKRLKLKYFPKFVSCIFLADEDKEECISALDRSSFETKIADFFADFEILQVKMEERYQEAKITKKKISAKIIRFVRYLHLLLSAGLNIYILSCDDNALHPLTQYSYNNIYSRVYIILTIIQTCLAFLALITLFFDPKSFHKFNHRWDSYCRKNQKNIPPLTRIEKLEWLKSPEAIGNQQLKRILLVDGYRSPFLYLSRNHGIETSIPLRILLGYNHATFFLKNREFLLNLFVLIFCGLSIWHPLYLPFQILFHVLKSPIIQDVLKSFYINARPFGMTIMLGAIIIFIYSMIGFFFLRDTLSVDNDKAVTTDFCPTSWICFVNFFNFGIRKTFFFFPIFKYMKYC